MVKHRHTEIDHQVQTNLIRRRILLWVILFTLTVVTMVGFSEVLTRLTAPQSLSSTWLSVGHRGLYLNPNEGSAIHHSREANRRVIYKFASPHLRSLGSVNSGKKVLVLGDSFTFGWLLRDKETFVGRLQHKIDDKFGQDKIQFMNAGHGGWGSADFLAYLEKFGQEVSPSWIIVFSNLDDLHRAEKSGLYTIKRTSRKGDKFTYLINANDISETRSFLKKWVRKIPGYNWLLENSHLVQFVRQRVILGLNIKVIGETNAPSKTSVSKQASSVRASEASAEPPSKISHQDIARAIFKEIHKWAIRHDSRLLVVDLGWNFRYPWLTDLLLNEGIRSVSLGSKMESYHPRLRDEFSFPHDGHPNPDGAKLISDAAWPYIAEFLSGAEE